MVLKQEQKQVVTEAVDIINKWGMCYLACRPRYGKSLIAMKIAELYGGRILFATVKSAIPGLQKVQAAMGINQDITISTYSSLHKVEKKYYDIIFLDEAHSNISSFPKMSKSREKLEPLIGPKSIIVWMSGSPQIESSSKMFHQLSITPRHSFFYYDNFYHWFNGSGHYKTKHCNKPGYGIIGLTKNTGSFRLSIDYTHTINFDHKIDPIMIRRGEEQAVGNIIEHIVDPDEITKAGVHEIKTKNIWQAADTTFIADGGASRLSKCHQIAGGTAIDVNGDGIILSYRKAQLVARNHLKDNVCVCSACKESLLKGAFSSTSKVCKVCVTTKQREQRWEKTKNKGHIYIITNKAWPEWCKIGKAQDISARMATYKTACPLKDFEIFHSIESDEIDPLEYSIHKSLKDIEHNDEWYKMSKEEAKNILKDAKGNINTDTKYLNEKYKAKKVCVFYKYIAEKELLSLYFDPLHLYQIDSNCTGIDLSHYDEMVIYSLTWSGSTYTQVLNRLVNTERKDIPNIHIYLTANTPDVKIFESVSNKRDFNTKYLKG